MKKTIIIVIALVVLGGIIYFAAQRTTMPGVGNFSMMQEAWRGQGSVVCDFVSPGDEYVKEESITVYIKNGQMKLMTEELTEMNANFLIKEDYLYFWEGQEGTKMKLLEGDIESFFIPIETDDEEAQANIEEAYQLNCRRTSIDDNMFDIPENVNFFDLSGVEYDYDLDYDNDYYEDIDWESLYKDIDPELLEELEEMIQVE